MEAETIARILWVGGAYLAGTLPFAYLVARARGVPEVIGAADRRRGEADAHILLAGRIGKPWAIVAAALDVLKAIGVVLSARELGDLSSGWLGAVGVALLLGHAWPLYLRSTAGRGIAAAAGVLLVLLPLQMAGAGALILVGIVLGFSGVATLGALALVPPAAALQGQPVPFVAMSGAIAALVALRRLEGVRGDHGVPRRRAVLRRLLYDASAGSR